MTAVANARRVTALLLVLAGSGCATSAAPPVTPLGAAVVATEVTEDGRAIAIPAGGITEVDVNSTVVLTMDHAAIAREAAKVAPAPGDDDWKPTDPKLTDSLRAMDTLTKAQQASAAKLKTLAEALTAGHPPAPAELNALGVLEGDVVKAAQQYAAVAGIDGATLFAQHRYEGINLERSRLLSLVQAQRGGATNLRWRMEASSTRAADIHLPNYDDIAEGESRLINKLDLSVDPRATQQLDAARALSADLNKAIAEQGSLGALRSKIDELVAQRVDQAKAALQDWVKLDLASLNDLVSRLARDVAKDPDYVKVVAALQSLDANGRALLNVCPAALSTIESAIRTRSVSAADADTVTKCIVQVRDVAPSLALDAQSLSEGAKGLVDKARKVDARATFKAEAAKLETVVHAKEIFDTARDRVTMALQVFDVQQKAARPIWRTDHFQDQPLEQALDTTLDVSRISGRKPDDQVFVRGSITKDGVPVLVGPYRTLRLMKEGARVDVSGALTFLRPTSLAAGEQKFRATPVITAALHYRDWRKPGRSHGCKLWNFLDPGIGFHVAYPDLGRTTLDSTSGKVVSEDPSAEIGLGGVVQLFGDLMQAGVGYDVQVSRPYWFIGFGLQRLTDLGISLPTGSSVKTP